MEATTTAVSGPADVLKTRDQTAYDESFTKAYETYYTKVFAFVYSRVPDVEAARDVVSSVFERAYRKGGDVRDQSAYAGWLFMIAKNQIAGALPAGEAELRRDRAGGRRAAVRRWAAGPGRRRIAG